jgi:hypothetical protein
MMKNHSFTEAVRCKIYNEIAIFYKISASFPRKKWGKLGEEGGRKDTQQF